MNSYTLTKQWFFFCSRNNETTPIHTALYLWLVECNNQQQWRETFSFTFEEVQTYVHISYKPFKKTLENLVLWGFIAILEKPVNRYAVYWKISLGKNTELKNSMGENTMLQSFSTAETPTLNDCSVGVRDGEFPELNGFSSGNSTTTNVYNNKTLFFPNNKNEREKTHTHTHEENSKNSDSFFSESEKSVKESFQEKKKSCAKKRKEFTQRESEFKTAVFTFSNLYEHSDLQAFYDYWSEPDVNMNMRWELEPTWELSRRIGKWKKLETQFTTPKFNPHGQIKSVQTKAGGYAAEELDYSIPL